MFSTFIASACLIAIAEIGDKTQLLAIIIAARCPGRAWAIIAGIFAATLINHAAVSFLGHWLGGYFDPTLTQWAASLLFIAVGIWALVPDKMEEEAVAACHARVFVATTIAFFIAEMGDKTQLATLTLAASHAVMWLAVLAGSTLGMMIANVPAVLLGEKLLKRVPLKLVRWVAAGLFMAMGVIGVMRLLMMQ